jgi:hypothetical protein
MSEPEQVVEQVVEVLAPADGHGGDGDPVLEQRSQPMIHAISSPIVAYAYV